MSGGFQPCWGEFRRLRRRWLLLLAFYVPVCYSAGWLSVRLFGSAKPAFVLALGWAVAAGLWGFRMIFWPCPRCGQAFLIPWGVFTGRCSRCGLPKWADPAGGAGMAS